MCWPATFLRSRSSFRARAAILRRRAVIRSLLAPSGLAGAALLSSLLAVSAGLSVSSAYLGSGRAALVACDPDGLTIGYSLDPAGRLSRVHLSGISTACAGGTVRLSLLAGSSVAGAGSASLPTTGFDGSADIDLLDLPAASTITSAQLVVEGR